MSAEIDLADVAEFQANPAAGLEAEGCGGGNCNSGGGSGGCNSGSGTGGAGGGGK